MKDSKRIYSLSVEDIQLVADEILNRKLDSNELKKVIDKLPENIPWYDSIYATFLDLGIVSDKGQGQEHER